jgi:hypothetical protein
MTSKASRQLLVLAAVLAAVIVVVVARRGNTPAGLGTASSSSRRGSATAAATKGMPVADVKLELLKGAQTGLEPSTRNPFQFKPKAAPPPSPPTGVGARGAPVVVGPPPPPPGPPPVPPIALKYIGVLDTAQGKVAMFRDSGGDIVNGKEGDIIDGRYRLLKIGVESADLAYVDGQGRQTIRLSGQ